MGATPKTVTIVGAPLDLGQGRRGVDMGPSAIRYAGLEERLSSFGCRVVDRGNVTTPEPEALAVVDERARFLPEILGACARLAAIVGDVVADGAVPLVLGGDHSVALGTLAGLRAAAGEPGGVIWIDAHGDLNTPASSPSGNVHGMPLAAALGMAGDRSRMTASRFPRSIPNGSSSSASRSLDPAERTLIKERGIRAITMTEIDRIGIEAAMREAIDRASGPGSPPLARPRRARPGDRAGRGNAGEGRLTYREAHLACEDLAEAGIIGSLELVEVNPILDRENGSAAIAVELAASALGKSIL